ncbi:MAG TPA: glycosyltransferase family 87 protein [Acetobacteraceae bacterium]|nr:glycosyltransferase family 87 protein [Acetobacteraceae bacterium]
MLLGLGGWLVYAWALRGQIAEDSMVFHIAARAWIDGLGSRLYDGFWITQQINQHFAAWLAKPLPLHPWVYPPSFLLLTLPFGYLPFAVAFPVFELASFAAFAAAARSQVTKGRFMLVALLLSPATAANVLLGQNGFITGALLVGGMGLLRSSPVVAGVLLGLMSYKPQFCMLIPVALLASRSWRTAVVAACTAAVLALASVAVFGIHPWQSWVGLMSGGSGLFHDWVREARINGMSVYACAVLLGASPGVANLAQATAILVSGAAVYRAFAFHGAMREQVRLAVFLAATVLAAPHVANYDAVLLAMSAILVVSVVSQEGFGARECVLASLIWLCPLFNPPAAFRIGLLTPILLLVFIGVLVSQARQPEQCAA